MSDSISRGDSPAPCPTPVVCTHAGPRYGPTTSVSPFPTEAVLGGTLGGLSVIVLALILYAACRHWNKARRRRPSLYRRGPTHRKKTGSALFSDPLFAYDVAALNKPWHSCTRMQPDLYIARPYVSARRQLSQRQMLAAMLDSPDDSSEFYPRNGGRGGGGGGGGGGGMSDESQYEPSIIAGSFVYHTPTNLPPHLTRTSHTGSQSHSQGAFQRELRPDLSYDSFKNHHLYEGSTRGVASSTLNGQHQPADFYL